MQGSSVFGRVCRSAANSWLGTVLDATYTSVAKHLGKWLDTLCYVAF